MPKKCKTHKNGECGVDQALRPGSWFRLRNREEETSVFSCPSPKNQMVAGEVWEPAAGRASEGQSCTSGQCVGQEQGQSSRGFLHLRLLSRLCAWSGAEAGGSHLPACQVTREALSCAARSSSWADPAHLQEQSGWNPGAVFHCDSPSPFLRSLGCAACTGKQGIQKTYLARLCNGRAGLGKKKIYLCWNALYAALQRDFFSILLFHILMLYSENTSVSQ